MCPRGRLVSAARRSWGSAIIRGFASKSFSIMRLGVACLKRSVIVLGVIVLISLALISCGGYGGTSTRRTARASGLKFRVLVSQDVSSPNTGGGGFILIDALKDLRANVAPINSPLQPTKMVLSNDRKITVAISIDNRAIDVVDNAKETASGAIQ